jgi:hypothetical protein
VPQLAARVHDGSLHRGRDRVPWSTGRYREKPDSAPSNNRICAVKSLILRDVRAQIPYAAEQRNQSDEQGDKTDDQGIKSAEHGKAPVVSSGRLRRPRARQVRGKGRPHRLLAGEAGYDGPVLAGLGGGQFVFGGARLQLLELQLELVEQLATAFGGLPEASWPNSART